MIKVGWGQTYTLTSDETWNSTTNMSSKTNYKNGIIIGGYTLTIIGTPLDGGLPIALNANKEINISGGSLILNGTTLTFNDGCKIFVTNGGKVKISNNSLLKHINGIGYFWEGIIAKHIFNNVPQFLVFPTADINSTTCTNSEWEGILNPAITYVEINNTTIENARIGVLSDGDYILSTYYGAVVRVRNSFFNNCEKGVKIIRGSSHGKNNFSGSYIMHTDFKWDNTLNMDKSELTHIHLSHTNGVNIGGCNFYNLSQTSECILERGIGILANKSSFSIKSDGNSCCTDEDGCPDNCYNPSIGVTKRRNTFERLGKGLYYIASSTIGNKFSCKFSDFKNCATGIEIYGGGMEEASIGNCSFHSDVSVYNSTFINSSSCANYAQMTGIFGLLTNGMNIYKNTFNTNLDQFHFIELQSPDNRDKSAIKNNTFTSTYSLQNCGENTQAISLSGNNDDLDIICNTFINIGYDIFINIDGNINDIPDMGRHQKNPNYQCISAQNTYSTIPINFTCYHNITNNHPSYDTYVGWKINGSSPSIQGSVIKNSTPNPGIQEVFGNTSSSYVRCAFTCSDLERKPVLSNKFINSANFYFYPNPTSGNFTIETSDYSENYQINIFDINGKLVYSNYLSEFSTIVSLENVIKGIYAVQIKGANSSFTKLIVIQ